MWYAIGVASYYIAPAGISPAGFWVPGVAILTPSSPPPVMADNIGPDGEYLSLFTTIHPVDAAIREAFRLKHGTGSAVQNVGQGFHSIRKNTADAPRKIRDEANRILSPFISRGDIRVLDLQIDTNRSPDLGAVWLKYRNLRSQSDRKYP